MPNVMGKKYAYTSEGKKKAKKAAKSLLTKQQASLPKALQQKIIKSKMKQS
tara:strand:+ start:1007 stop:1159 length:153 start_codon:yes stop_codon:yes gene_type:complete